MTNGHGIVGSPIIPQKGDNYVLFPNTMNGTREVRKQNHSLNFPFIIVEVILNSSKFLHIYNQIFSPRVSGH